MIQLLPFENAAEHARYCEAAGVMMEEGAVGFKIFSEQEKLGLCQIKFVQDAAYVLTLQAINDSISVSMLQNVFSEIMLFLCAAEAKSVIFPIQSENDLMICQNLGFDHVSDTLFVFDFPNGEENVSDEESIRTCHCDRAH